MGIPFDLIHAGGTACFLWLIAEPMIEKLERIKVKYGLKSVRNISSHSLRKTFGRKVFESAGENANMALVRLSELFNHSNVAITKIYLGIRQEELLETYDLLDF